MHPFRLRSLAACVAGLVSIPASAVIINGAPGAGATLAFDGVGTVTNAFGSASGVLIDPWHVLAAAHEVYDSTTHAPFAASTVSFNAGSGAVTASKIVIPAGYVGGNPTVSGSLSDYTTSDKADLAVITLSSPITNKTTYAYNTGSIVETAGGTATLVGYGFGGDGTNGEIPGTYPFGTKRQGNNLIDLVTTNLSGTTVTDGGGNQAKLPNGVIAWDFDVYSATSPTNGPLGGPAVNSTEGDASLGDSGGPVFQFNSATQQYVITGIIIDGTNNTSFGEISWATQTSAYSSFIAANTPEPASLAVLGIGGVLLAARRRAKR